MLSQEHTCLPLTRDVIAWALHKWGALLRDATTSIHAEVYQHPAALVVSALASVEMIPDLARVFFSPSSRLQALVLTLCADGEVLLSPHVLMGAACALRLHQLIWRAATPDSTYY